MTLLRHAHAERRDPGSQLERVVLRLRKMLLAGEFKPGERLAELMLVPLLEASRTPVRLALDRLAHEGLLEKLPTAGFRVRAFAVADIFDAIEVRGVLEGMAARLAAERLESDSDVRHLRRYYQEAAGLLPITLERFIRYIDLNERFHREFWMLARSPMLLQSIERHIALPFAAPGAAVFTDDPVAGEADTVVALEHHRAIVDAIATGQGSRAEALAREHSYVARRALERALRSRELFKRMPGATLISATERPEAAARGTAPETEDHA